jgi:hypothetical protein
VSDEQTWSEVCAALEAAEAERDQARVWIGKAKSLTERLTDTITRAENAEAERDALRATLREIASMARDAKGARAATAKVALGMLANIAEEAANK